MKKIILVSLVISHSVFAQNQGVKVFIVDKNIDSTSLEKKYEVKKEAELINVVPDRQKREVLFKDISFPESWDELSKDIFYMDLKNKKISDIVKKYPEFKKEVLVKLKNDLK